MVMPAFNFEYPDETQMKENSEHVLEITKTLHEAYDIIHHLVEKETRYDKIRYDSGHYDIKFEPGRMLSYTDQFIKS